MVDVFLKNNMCGVNLCELLKLNQVIIGLDIGDKIIGISASDRRIKIASSVASFSRKNEKHDFENIATLLQKYNIGLIIFGWPVQMNGLPGSQCAKIECFVQKLCEHIPTNYAKWDERFSTSVVDSVLISADLSRNKRKKVIDKIAAVYILQGALDFLNRHHYEQKIL